ncbi:MAG: vWA domain-containing protein [Acidobacteriota bacterium]
MTICRNPGWSVCLRVAIVALVAAALAAPVAWAQCGPMDVVFVVDTTGSMGGAIDNVKSELPSIISQIQTASGGDYQLGLVEFHDDVHVIADLASGNTDAVQAGINGLTAGGGAGESEASDEALRTVVEGLRASDRTGGQQTGDFLGRFRPGAAKIIIVITDARPAGFDDSYTAGVDDVSAANVAQEAATRDIHISAVFVPTEASVFFGVGDTVTAIMSNYAALSGGIYIKTNPDGTGTAQAINDIIANCGGFSGFFVQVTPSPQDVGNDESRAFDVKTQASRRFEADLELSIPDLPEGLTATITPALIPSPGTGNARILITAGPLALPGLYEISVVVTGGGFTRIAVFELNLFCDPPFIYGLPGNQPQDQSTPVGGSVQISVRPGGTGPFFYQWYRGPSGSTHFPITGATSSDLDTGPVNSTSQFWVRVSNACGSVDSRTASVFSSLNRSRGTVR